MSEDTLVPGKAELQGREERPQGRDEGVPRPGRRLLATVLALTALLLAIGIWVGWRAYERDQHRLRQELAQSARAAATVADRFLEDRVTLLRAIAADPAIRAGRPAESRAYLESLELGPDVFSGGIGLFDVDGSLRVAVRRRPLNAVHESLAVRNFVRRTAQRPGVSVGTAVDARGMLLIPIAVPVSVPETGGLSFLLVGLVRPDASQGFRGMLAISEDLVVVDRGGRVLIGGGETTRIPRDRGTLLRTLRAQRRGLVEPETDILGRSGRTLGFATVTRAGWVVISDSPTGELLRPARIRLGQDVAALLLGVLIAMGAAALVAGKLDRTARHLALSRWFERRLESAVTALAATNEPGRLAEIAVEAALDILPADTVAVVERGGDGRLTVVHSREGFHAPRVPPEEIARRALETNAVVWEDTAGLPTLALPLGDDQALVAGLSRKTTELETSCVTALARRVGAAVARARLFNELQVAERVLRAQTGLLQAVADGTPDLIFAKDTEGDFLMLNQATAEILGTTVREALGRQEGEFLETPDVADSVTAERRVQLTGEAAHGERRFGTKDDAVFVVNRAPLFDEERTVIGTVTVGHDITERTRMEQARMEALARESEIRRRVQLLQSITAALANAATSREIAQAIVDESERRLDADIVSVLLESDGVLKAVAGHGFRAREPFATDGATPQAAAFRSGRTIAIASLDADALTAYPNLTDVPPSWSSAIFVPISHEHVPTGVLSWASHRPRAFDEDFVQLVEAVARQAALAFERARLFEAERRIAAELQRSMLPAGFPEIEGAQFAVRYEAGAEDLAVGGDWYEVMLLPTYRVALVVGDVVGRGLPAAAAMAQLRSAASALAATTDGPGALLERLDAFAGRTDGGQFATVAVCVLDPATGLLRYACAAHPPPLVLYPDGEAAYLEEGRSPPLCAVDGGIRPEAAVRLPVGSTLLLYTDGLVERRGTSLDARLEQLRVSLVRHAGLPFENLGDALISDLLGGDPIDDDVALLMTTISGPPADALSVRVGGTPDQVPVLRHRLRDWLDQRNVSREIEDDVILAVGEAVANAVEHAYRGRSRGTVDLVAWMPVDRTVICVEVSDAGGWSEGAGDVDRGRGLVIMRAVLDDVDVVRTADGTSVRMTKRLSRPL
jgi:PAS domain S-box-containing protein